MIPFILYFLTLIFLLVFLIGITVYTLSLIYSSFKGSPYVPTSKKRIKEILKTADLKKGKLFIELGSGDGRIVRTAVNQYQVKGIGVDINPLLIFWAKILGSKNIDFKVEDIFKTDLRKADYLYIFLMPKLIEDLKEKLEKELKKGTVVISHGFPIEYWQKKLYKKIDSKPFPTYFYKK